MTGSSPASTATCRAVYAIRLWKEGEFGVRRIFLPVAGPEKVAKVTHLASGRTLGFGIEDGLLAVDLPRDLTLDPYAEAFRCE